MIGEQGRLDVVAHAAGVDDPDAKELIAEAIMTGEPVNVTSRLEVNAWRRVLTVNLDGTFHVLRAALRAMARSAFDAPAGYPHYAASKANVHASGSRPTRQRHGHGGAA